jgi:putative FmdB family regulatory protein
MPTYDYKCRDCGHTFEEFHSMNKKLKKCQGCGKNKLERLIGSGGAVLFKGGGFYQTDYRSRRYIADKQYSNRQARKAEKLSK